MLFFEQKTAYEVRISDWSSDVCSAELRRQDRQRAEVVDAVAQPARIAHADRIAREPLDRLADRLAADRARDHRLHVGDVEPIARRGRTIDIEVAIAAAGRPVGEGGGDPRHAVGDLGSEEHTYEL